MSQACRHCPRGRACQPRSHEHAAAAFGSRPPTQRLRSWVRWQRLPGSSSPSPPCGRRSGKLGSRAHRRCVPESSTSSPTRRPSRRLAGTVPGVEVTRAEAGTAGSPTPPYRVRARAVAGTLLPTASTDPARAMALLPASCRILLRSRRQEGEPDCSSAGMAEPAAEG
jgi:hypothetical protein